MVTTPPDPFLDEAKSLACIHCGLCLASCPTYLESGNENNSPRGRIYLMRALQSGRAELDAATVRPLDACLGCRACEAVCPSGVQYGALLEETRDHIERHHKRSPFQTFLRRVAIEKVFPYPARLKAALLPARLIHKADASHLFPSFLRDMLSLVPKEFEDVPLPECSPASRCSGIGVPPVHSDVEANQTDIQTTNQRLAPRGRVGFISGCAMSVMFGTTNEASVRLLNRVGFDVFTPKSQGCCGALHAHSGKLEDAREAARHNIAAFEKLDLDAIIINAAGCGSTLKEYGQLLEHDAKWTDRARAFGNKVKDLTEFLAKLIEDLKPLSTSAPSVRVTYHDACHLAHAQRITKPPRDLVKAIAGTSYVELPESDVCCGSAGTYNLTEPEMAARLQKRKITNILNTGADIVVTSNPGCILQMLAGLNAAGASRVKVVHIADYLAEHLR